MSGNTKMRIVILFDDELRVAARALRAFTKTANSPDAKQEATGDALQEAIRACRVALYHVDDDPAMTLMLLRRDDIPLKSQYAVSYDKDETEEAKP